MATGTPRRRGDGSEAGKPAGSDLPRPDASIPQEELRFGVVLNGGVSLAVWMGGVVREIDDVTRALAARPAPDHEVHDTRSIYGFLLDLVRCRARADVIAGTSAGGINGAALGMAQLNANADVASLRDIWADQGRMESLLREPFKGSPPSLLKGDEYFYPALERALSSLARGWEPVRDTAWGDPGDERRRPLDLTITTTLLSGARRVTVDSMGQHIGERIHDATFTFRSGIRPAAGSVAPDDFAEDRRATTVRALALAARCTAGFPVAFEPSYVPVNASDEVKPDMAPFASWADQGVPAPGEPPDADVSRYAVDGGLLANMPTRHVLRAIQDMPARDPVRRVVLLIHPHAPVDGPVPADRPDDPPELTSTLTGLLTALQAQGQRTYATDLEEHNRRASGRRTTRGDILGTLSGTEPGQLGRLAAELWPHFRVHTARRLSRELADPATTAGASLPPAPGAAATARAAADATPGGTSTGPPMVLLPERGALPEQAVLTAAAAWGLDAALGVADAASDYLRRLAWQVRHEAEEVMRARESVLQARRELAGLREQGLAGGPAGDVTPPPGAVAGSDVERTVLGDPLGATTAAAAGGRPGPGITGQVASRLAVITTAVSRTRKAFAHVLALPLADPDLVPWQEVVLATRTRGALLNRLYQLHIATTCIADEEVTESVNPFDVVQISLQTTDPFTVVTRTGDDKLAGMALSRFGGFLKRSWRMNDWTWGRLDAATMLSRIVLDPKRLRRVALLSPPNAPYAAVVEGPDAEAHAAARAEELVDRMARAFLPAAWADDAALRAAVQQARREARTSLSAVFLPAGRRPDLPPAAPALADLAAWALHLRIITEELPAIASAIRVDAAEGAYRRSMGQVLLAQHQGLVRRIERLPTRITEDGTAQHQRRLEFGLLALRAFDRAGIGREPLAREGTSDQMIRTATTAASVGVSVLDGERSGLGAFKPVTRTLRGGMMLPYWIANGLTAGGGVARVLALGALALGGVLLALSLLSVVGSWAAVLGGGVALFGLGYAALRSGTLLHGLVLLLPVVPLAVVGFEMRRNPAPAATTSSGQIVLVAAIALVLGLIVIGSLPAEIASPASFALARWRALRRWLGSAWYWLRRLPGWLARHRVPVVVAAVGAVAATAAVLWRDRWVPGWLATTLSSPPVWFGILLVAGTLIGSWRAAETGRQLRLYTRGTRLADGAAAGQRVWRANAVVHPVGTASGWSVAYGVAGGLVALWLFRLDPRDTAIEVLAWTFAAGALVLVLVVPVWMPYRFWRRQARALAPKLPSLATAAGDPRQQAALLQVLVRRGLTYSRLVRPATDHPEVLRLTPFGLRVAACVPAPDDSVLLPETEVLSRRAPARPRAQWQKRGAPVAVYPETRQPLPDAEPAPDPGAAAPAGAGTNRTD